jgi:HK97 gp10 family phage protein
MVVKSRITTKGFEEYLEAIAKAGQNIDAIADEALLAGGEVLLEGMDRRVPKDTHNLEKHLALIGPVQDGNLHYVEVGIPPTTDANTARYGNVQEYGSANTPAQPYIRPSLDHDMGKARARMKEVFVEKGAL